MQALALVLAGVNVAFLLASIALTVRTKRRLRRARRYEERAQQALYEAAVERGKVIVLPRPTCPPTTAIPTQHVVGQ